MNDADLPPDSVIRSSGLTIWISPDGAEMRRIVDAAGRELLWDGDPAFWTGRAPILFPVVGVLAGGRTRVDGQDYAMPKHGFARRSRFTIVEQSAEAVVMRLEDSPATRAVYPFAFRLDLAFRVEGSRLEMTATVYNPGTEVLPASFGYHPALRWPLPYGGARADHVVRFDQDEEAPIRRVSSDGTIDPKPRPSPVRGREMALSDALFADDAVVFDRLESRGLCYGAPGTPGVRVDFPDMPYLGIWMKPGADYLCIEPWQGMADPTGFTGDFREKPGVIEIAPGQERRFIVRIAFGVDV